MLAVSPVNVAVVVLPFRVALSGLAVIFFLMIRRPPRSTLPVDDEQSGCVIVPTTGAGGVTG